MRWHFTEAFYIASKKHADKTALYFGEYSFSYAKINQKADAIARIIVLSNPPKDKIVPLVLDRSPYTIITMLGILKAGCAFLPISPSSPCSRIEYILEEIQATMLFCDTSIAFKLPSHITTINPKTIDFDSNDAVEVPYQDNDLAYVMYTSGSTGKPKGVMIEHQSMMNLFSSLSQTLDLSHKDLFLALTDYTFDISLIELLMPLTLGASIVLTEHGVVADGKKIKQYLNEFQVSFMQATPLTWDILLKNDWSNNGTSRILVGGEQFKTSLAKKLHYEKGNVWNVYGPTETSMWSMIHHVQGPLSSESVPLGSPIANTTLKLVFDEHLQKDELYIGGLGLARGYLNAAELTHTKFIIDKATKERFYKTGDLVTKTDDGLLCFCGRKDDQLKFGGIRIEAGEIETSIEQEVFVKKAVVKVHEHDEYYKTLAAYVEIDEEALFAQGSHIISDDSSSYMEQIYNETYSHAKEFECETINTCGWQNSFDNTTFKPEELLEAYSTMKHYIRHADLTHVLEVGCGMGGLLLDYLPHAKEVTVAEISPNAIEYVSSIIPKTELHKVRFKLESMINIHEVNQYSCIVINSVIQYLPSIKSLMDSLRQLVKATKPGGTLFIGDVRSLELFDAFLNIKDAYHHASHHSAHLYYKSRDAEIVLSPLFFYALKTQLNRISWVDINVKHGQYDNEVNYFRYDVVLHIEKEVLEIESTVLGFNELNSIEEVKDLTRDTSRPIKIQNIPFYYLSTLCDTLGISEHHNVSGLFHATPFDDTNFFASTLLHHQFESYESLVHYHPNAPYHYVNLLLQPISSQHVLIRPIEKEKITLLQEHFREPFSPWLQQFCFDHIKMSVRKHVMTWVTPSIYIWVEKWPQTINGKLDKTKLSLPITYTHKKEKSSILSQLKQMWLNITGDDAVIAQEYWVHGVSSLSMYYFLATINETFHLHMTYHEFHEHHTLEKLAAFIEGLLDSSHSKETP